MRASAGERSSVGGLPDFFELRDVELSTVFACVFVFLVMGLLLLGVDLLLLAANAFVSCA